MRNPFSTIERDIIRPKPRLLPVDWAERNIVLGKRSPAPGPFRRNTKPLLTSVINSIEDPRYSETLVTADTQDGKSLSIQIAVAYWLEYKAADVGYGIPNKTLAKRIYDAKLKPMFQEVPALYKLFPVKGSGSRGGFPDMQILNNGAQFLFMGAGSTADTAEATIQFLAIDETDKADKPSQDGREAGSIFEMIRRTDAHQLTRHIFYGCTCTTLKGFIWNGYVAGTQGEANFCCPQCHQWFTFEWSWDNLALAWDDNTNENTAMNTAYYPCPHCDFHIRERDRIFMLRHPLWVHDGEQIEQCKKKDLDDFGPFDETATVKSGRRNAYYCVTGERKQVHRVSYRWNRLTSPFTNLGLVAAKIRAAMDNDSSRKDISLYDMNIPWEGNILEGSEVHKDTLLARIAASTYITAADRKLPFVYDQEHVMVTGGIDIGGRDLHAVFDAWVVDDKKTKNLVCSYRIDWFMPYQYPDPYDNMPIFHGLEHVREHVAQGWLDADGARFWPSVIGIDAGYQGNKTRNTQRVVGGGDEQVYRFCRTWGQNIWRPVMGLNTLGAKGITQISILKERGIALYLIDTDLAKYEIQHMVNLPDDVPGVWHVPSNMPQRYARGMAAERRVVFINDKKEENAKWEVVDGYNHPLDAQVYSWALARRKGVKPPVGKAGLEAAQAAEGDTHVEEKE